VETRDDICVELHSKPQLLCALRGLVRSYAANLGFPAEQVDEVVLAVDEACANVMRHSYGGALDGHIALALRSADGVFELELVDQGTPAPAEKVARKSLESPKDMDQLRPGGLGVQLIYSVFDDVVYEPGTTQGNRVRMRLACPQGDTGTAHGT
jgi:anti-sigma regulatory factor (Ser/Thr protein kinase)